MRKRDPIRDITIAAFGTAMSEAVIKGDEEKLERLQLALEEYMGKEDDPDDPKRAGEESA